MRPAGRFAGVDPEPRSGLRGGHIPGSRSLPYTELVAPDGTLLPPEALRRRLAEAGVDPARPVVATCGSGTSACTLIHALHLLGHARPRCTTARGPSGAAARTRRSRPGRHDRASVRTAVSLAQHRDRLRRAVSAAVRGGRRVRDGADAPRRPGRLGAGRLSSRSSRSPSAASASAGIVGLAGRRRARRGAGPRGAPSPAPWLWREDWAARRRHRFDRARRCGRRGSLPRSGT